MALTPFLPIRDRLPTRVFPFVNYVLIAVNIAVFVQETAAAMSRGHPGGLEPGMWALVPARFFHDPVFGFETVFTSMFLHASWSHVLGNMLFLWIFGDNVEDAMGHVRYLVYYLLGGVCAAAAQTLMDPTSMIPMVGASGAISAVLAAYAFLYPRSPITVLNPIFILWFFFGLFLQLPAWLVIGEYLRRQPLRRAHEQRAGRRRLHGARRGLRGRSFPAPAVHGRPRPRRRLRALAAPGRAARGPAETPGDHSARRSMRPLSTATSAVAVTDRTLPSMKP